MVASSLLLLRVFYLLVLVLVLSVGNGMELT